MLMGLSEPKYKENDDIDSKISKKMSKSKPSSAIFMTDTKDEIYKKIQKAYCPEATILNNPILEYCKYIIFEKIPSFDINRPTKYGGNISYKSYNELEKDYINKKIHPADLKRSCKYIDELIEPVENILETIKS